MQKLTIIAWHINHRFLWAKESCFDHMNEPIYKYIIYNKRHAEVVLHTIFIIYI